MQTSVSLEADILDAAILIVDDQAVNIELLVEMLRQAGYTHVESTGDAEKVCGLYRENHYDLIILDLVMPRIDGFQVLEGLKAIETDGYVPVLVITAHPSHKLQALTAGAKDFISKPFNFMEAKNRIHNLLEVRILYKKVGEYNRLLEDKVRERTAEIENLKEQLRRENERLHEDIDFKGQLVNDLSHQLRTPLTSMRGAMEVSLQHSRTVAEYRSITESTISEIDRITTLINTMLSLAKLDAHADNLKYAPCDLAVLMQETIAELAPLWAEKNIRFDYRFSGEEFVVEAEAFRLKQAVINILDNAYKHTPCGGQITVELHRDYRERAEYFRLIIINSGNPIPETALPRLFTPFYQAGSLPPETAEKGFGLGLSICRKIIDLHRGTIRAFNPDAGGAGFEITLPAGRPAVD